MIAATNGWIVAFDNFSHLPDWLSDALCRVTTLGSFSTRALYTDRGETLLTAQRPVLLNGIEQVATRADFLSRSVLLTLPRIVEEDRRAEHEFWQDFETARPRILGALLDAVVGALERLPSVELPRRPRMADFAEWATAAEHALGWPSGTFLTAYERNLVRGSRQVLEANPLGPAIVNLVANGPWQGTASELIEALCDGQRRVPTNPLAMSNVLDRLEGALGGVGVVVERWRTEHARIIRISRVADERKETDGVQAA